MAGRGFAPGKAILLGEHAVVYGYPALAAPTLPFGVEAWVEDEPSGERGRVVWDLEDDAESMTSGLDAAMAALRGLMDAGDGPLRVRLRSTLPPSAGMGSSAALAVALARALAEHRGVHLDDRGAARLAFAVEQGFHGRASGVDNTTAAHGRALRFTAGSEPEPLLVRGEWPFLLVHSGVRSATREVVQDVAQAREREPARVDTLFRAMAEQVEAGQRALGQGDPETFAASMEANHTLLGRLGVGHPAVDAVIDALLSEGVRAAKVTGAGRGGLVLALARDTAHRWDLLRGRRDAWPLDLVQDGSD